MKETTQSKIKTSPIMETQKLTLKNAIPVVVEAVRADTTLLIKGLRALYDRQTPVEHAVRKTVYHNGQGFYPRDAKFMESAVAAIEGDTLPGEFAATLRVRLPRYGRQLTEVLASDVGIEIVPARRGRPAGSRKVEVVEVVGQEPLLLDPSV